MKRNTFNELPYLYTNAVLIHTKFEFLFFCKYIIGKKFNGNANNISSFFFLILEYITFMQFIRQA